MPRTSEQHRVTGETDVRLRLDLDGTGRADVATGVGFFDHMLDLLARHAVVDLSIEAKGDLHVDAHHTVEDVGLALGDALHEALGDKAGIRRYGDARVPMDEVLVAAAIDLSGRPAFACDFGWPAGATIGSFPCELVEEFFKSLATRGQFAMHIDIVRGGNLHHVAEAAFKATARALREAVETDPRRQGVPSTKGTL
jgi:imidazoleglycerol-phosphate dehydratase